MNKLDAEKQLSLVRKSSVNSVLIVDDHPVTRGGLATIIGQSNQLTVAGEAASPEEAIDFLHKNPVDAAVVDIVLKGGSGLDLVPRMLAQFPELRIVMLSMHEEQLYAQRALKAGAHGYVMKERAADEIVAALKTALAGGVYVSSRMQSSLLSRLRTAKPLSGMQLPIDSLTQREQEVLTLIGSGFGTKDVAQQLGLSVKTIDSYRENLKQKLGLASGVELVRMAIHWAALRPVCTTDKA